MLCVDDSEQCECGVGVSVNDVEVSRMSCLLFVLEFIYNRIKKSEDQGKVSR